MNHLNEQGIVFSAEQKDIKEYFTDPMRFQKPAFFRWRKEQSVSYLWFLYSA